MRFLQSTVKSVCRAAEGFLLDVIEAGSFLELAAGCSTWLGFVARCLPAAKRACSTAKNSASGTCVSSLSASVLRQVLQNVQVQQCFLSNCRGCEGITCSICMFSEDRCSYQTGCFAVLRVSTHCSTLFVRVASHETFATCHHAGSGCSFFQSCHFSKLLDSCINDHTVYKAIDTWYCKTAEAAMPHAFT